MRLLFKLIFTAILMFCLWEGFYFAMELMTFPSDLLVFVGIVGLCVLCFIIVWAISALWRPECRKVLDCSQSQR